MLRSLVALTLTSTFISGSALADDLLPPVRFGMIPSIAHERMEVEFQPIAEHLGRAIGRKIEIVIAKDYGEIAGRIERREIEFAILFPLAYAQSVRKVPPVELMGCSVRQGKPDYRGYFITRQDSRIRRLEDLRGHSIGFVDPGSTSGYLFPVQVLMSQKLIDSPKGVESFFSEVKFLKSHGAVIQAVANGDVAAGTVFDGAIALSARTGIDAGSLRILARTAPIPHEAVVAIPGIDEKLKLSFRAALLALDTRSAEGRAVLRPMITDLHLNGFVACDASVFDPVRVLVESDAP